MTASHLEIILEQEQQQKKIPTQNLLNLFRKEYFKRQLCNNRN